MNQYIIRKRIIHLFIILLFVTSCEWYKKGFILNDSNQLPFKGSIALFSFDDPRYLSHTQTGEKDEWALSLTNAEGKRIYIIFFSMYSGEISDSFCINPEPEPLGNCPSILWTGTDFVLVYTTLINNEPSLMFVRFNRDKKILNQAELVKPDGTKIIDSFYQVSLAKNQNNYALGLTGPDVRILLFEENNSHKALIKIQKEFLVDSSAGSNPSLLWNDASREYAFAWKTGTRRLVFDRFSPDFSNRTAFYSKVMSENDFSLNWDYINDRYYLARLDKERKQIYLESYSREKGIFNKESTIPYEDEPEYLSLAYNGKDFSIIWCEKNDNHINYAY